MYNDNNQNKLPILPKILFRIAILLVAFIVVYVVTNMNGKKSANKENDNVSSTVNKIAEQKEEKKESKPVENKEEIKKEEKETNKDSKNFEYAGKKNVKLYTDKAFDSVTDKEGLDDFYSDGLTDHDTIMLALQNDETRIVVTEMSYEKYIVYVQKLIDDLKQLSPEEREKNYAEMVNLGYSDVELSYFKKVVNDEPVTDEEKIYFYQEYILQDLLAYNAKEDETFKFLGRDDIVIDGKKVQRFEYVYDDPTTGEKIRFYDVAVYKDQENIFDIGLWGYEKDFIKNIDSYKTILESFTTK